DLGLRRTDRDRDDERLLPGREHPFGEPVDVVERELACERGRGALVVVLVEVLLVDADPHDRPLLDEHLAAVAEHLAALGPGALGGDRVALGRVGVHDGGVPHRRPALLALGVGDADEPRRRLDDHRLDVGAHVVGPGERDVAQVLGLRVALALGDLRDAGDGDRAGHLDDLAEQRLELLGRRGRVGPLGERDAVERAVGEVGGQRLGDRRRVGLLLRAAAGRDADDGDRDRADDDGDTAATHASHPRGGGGRRPETRTAPPPNLHGGPRQRRSADSSASTTSGEPSATTGPAASSAPSARSAGASCRVSRSGSALMNRVARNATTTSGIATTNTWCSASASPIRIASSTGSGSWASTFGSSTASMPISVPAGICAAAAGSRWSAIAAGSRLAITVPSTAMPTVPPADRKN